MKTGILVLMAAIFILGVIIEIYAEHRHVRKKAKNQKIFVEIDQVLSYIQLAARMFWLVFIAIFLEIFLAYVKIGTFISINWLKILCTLLIENGILVIFALFVITFLVKRGIKKYQITKYDTEDDDTSTALKIYYTVTIIASCLCLAIIVIKLNFGNTKSFSNLDEYIVNRLIMWSLSIISSWISIDFKFKDEYSIVEKIKNSLHKNLYPLCKNLKRTWCFFLTTVTCCVLTLFLTFWTEQTSNMFVLIGCIMVSFSFGLIFSNKCLKKFSKSPSTGLSNQILYDAIKSMNKKGNVHRRYQTIEYDLIKEDNKRYLIIDKDQRELLESKEYIELYFEIKNKLTKFIND